MATEDALAAGPVPEVSVIVPTCGRPEMLLDCVASILRNDFQEFEIIIVDQDRARTLEAELVRRFNGDGRLAYLFLDNASLSRARNLGVSRARGHILVFCDDDTETDPGWLRAYVETFDACGREPVVVGGRLDPLWLAPRPRWLPESKEYLLGIYNHLDGLVPMPGPDLPDRSELRGSPEGHGRHRALRRAPRVQLRAQARHDRGRGQSPLAPRPNTPASGFTIRAPPAPGTRCRLRS